MYIPPSFSSQEDWFLCKIMSNFKFQNWEMQETIFLIVLCHFLFWLQILFWIYPKRKKMLPLINYTKECQHLIETCSIHCPPSLTHRLSSTDQVDTDSYTFLRETQYFLVAKGSPLAFHCFFAASSDNSCSPKGKQTRLESGPRYIRWCTTKSEKALK